MRCSEESIVNTLKVSLREFWKEFEACGGFFDFVCSFLKRTWEEDIESKVVENFSYVLIGYWIHSIKAITTEEHLGDLRKLYICEIFIS